MLGLQTAVVCILCFLILLLPQAVYSDHHYITVKVKKVKIQDSYQQEVEYVGVLESNQNSQIGFELPGKVVAIFFDDGDKISKGDMLAKLDTSRLEGELRQEKAALKSAISQLHLTELTLERFKTASKQQAITPQELDEAIQAHASAAATVDKHLANLDLIEVNLNKSVLIAPYDAVISNRGVDVGNIIQPATTIFNIIQNDILKARIGVESRMARKFSVGEHVFLQINAEHYHVKITKIIPIMDKTTRTIDFIIDVDNSNNQFYVGDIATLRLNKTIKARGSWLPAASLTSSVKGLWSVFVAKKEENTYKIYTRNIDLLYHKDNKVFAQSSLEEGELIVVTGVNRISSHQRVNVDIINGNSIDEKQQQ